MIDDPLNDIDCLLLVTQRARSGLTQDSVIYLAEQFTSTRKLATWIRRLPQRNDEGLPSDGPKVACDVPQRVRIPAPDPNCVERAAMYLAIAEHIDPGPHRQLATMTIPGGRHTFAVEDDEPVHLDPLVTRNALEAGMYLMHARSRPPLLSPHESLSWAMGLAAEPLGKNKQSKKMWRNAAFAASALEDGSTLSHELASQLGLVLAIAEQEAILFGETGLELVHRVLTRCESLLESACMLRDQETGAFSSSRVMTNSERDRLSVAKFSPCECERKRSVSNSVRNGSWKIPSLQTMAGHLKLGSKIAAPWAKMAVKMKLASWGIPPETVDEFEKQMLSSAKASEKNAKKGDGENESKKNIATIRAEEKTSIENKKSFSSMNVRPSLSSHYQYGMLVLLSPKRSIGL